MYKCLPFEKLKQLKNCFQKSNKKNMFNKKQSSFLLCLI